MMGGKKISPVPRRETACRAAEAAKALRGKIMTELGFKMTERMEEWIWKKFTTEQNRIHVPRRTRRGQRRFYV